MTPSAAKLEAYLGGLAEKDVLGWMVAYTFRETHVAHDDLVKWFAELGLNEAYLPSRPRKDHAFTNATGPKRRLRYSLPDGNKVEVFVRDVTKGVAGGVKEKIVRHVVREVRDGKKLRYSENVGELIFYLPRPTPKPKKGGKGTPPKPKPALRWNRTGLDNAQLQPGELEKIETFTEEMLDLYKLLCDSHDVMKLRGVVRNYILGMNAVPLANGLYFVHASRRNSVEQLNQLVNDKLGATCNLLVFPLPDSPKQREAVTEAFEDQLQKQVAMAIEEIERLEGRRKVTPEDYGAARAMIEELRSSTDEYVNRLGAARNVVNIQLDLADRSMTKLLTRLSEAS